jgi:hypothetical protein
MGKYPRKQPLTNSTAPRNSTYIMNIRTPISEANHTPGTNCWNQIRAPNGKHPIAALPTYTVKALEYLSTPDKEKRHELSRLAVSFPDASAKQLSWNALHPSSSVLGAFRVSPFTLFASGSSSSSSSSVLFLLPPRFPLRNTGISAVFPDTSFLQISHLVSYSHL